MATLRSETRFSRRPTRIAIALQTTETSSSPLLSFEQLQWKLNFPENTKWWERIQYKAKRVLETVDPASQTTRIVSPRSSGNTQMIVEAYLPTQPASTNPIIRMGMTTQAGASLPLNQTTREKLNLSKINEASTMALIFLWIDPQYRGLQWGIEAMRIVRYIHFSLGAECTVIVANDKDSGRLVSWYEQQGFVQALELQECLGSPNQIYGTAMVGRTLAEEPLKALVIEDAF